MIGDKDLQNDVEQGEGYKVDIMRIPDDHRWPLNATVRVHVQQTADPAFICSTVSRKDYILR